MLFLSSHRLPVLLYQSLLSLFSGFSGSRLIWGITVGTSSAASDQLPEEEVWAHEPVEAEEEAEVEGWRRHEMARRGLWEKADGRSGFS